MKLFTFPASPGCRPIAMFIADHGMDVEEHVIDLMSGQQYSPEFITINPNSAVPVLQDGDFVLTESSAILKYLADLIDSPTYPKALRARALVNSAMDWFNTGMYRNFGYSLCYPQVLPHVKWEDANAQSLLLATGQAGSRKLLSIMNDHMLANGRKWLCGAELTIADYFASGILTLGELIGCDFLAWPNIRQWSERMEAMPNWRSANAGLYEWAKFTNTQEYVRI